MATWKQDHDYACDSSFCIGAPVKQTVHKAFHAVFGDWSLGPAFDCYPAHHRDKVTNYISFFTERVHPDRRLFSLESVFIVGPASQ